MNDQRKTAGLELWPALIDTMLFPGFADGEEAARDRGAYVVRTDETGGEGRWLFTLVVNPALDQASRERLMWLTSMAPELWRALRDAVIGLRSLTADRPATAESEEEYAGVVKLLTEAAGFVPFGRDGSAGPSEAGRRGVNEDTLYRLTMGEPAGGVPPESPKPAAAAAQSDPDGPFNVVVPVWDHVARLRASGMSLAPALYMVASIAIGDVATATQRWPTDRPEVGPDAWPDGDEGGVLEARLGPAFNAVGDVLAKLCGRYAAADARRVINGTPRKGATAAGAEPDAPPAAVR